MAVSVALKGSYKSGSFTQRTRTFFDLHANCLAVDARGKLWAGTDAGLFSFEDGAFKVLPLCACEAQAVNALHSAADGTLWVSCCSAVYSVKKGKVKQIAQFEEAVKDFAQDESGLYALTHSMIYVLQDGAFIPKRAAEGGGKKLAVYGGVLHLLSELALLILDGKRPSWKAILPQFSDVPACEIHDIRFDGAGHLWLSTAEGAVVYDRKSYWLKPDKAANLPAECIFSSVQDAVGGRYFASDNGVIYLKNGKTYYYGARRWLPENTVHAIAVTADGKQIWAATAKGLSMIAAKGMSLLEKADHFQKNVENHHVRDIGFVTVRTGLENEDIRTGHVEISDNDGLWTANYVASQSFRYAVTKDREALEQARRSMNAMLYLTRVTGIPGFTARAIRREGEHGFGDGNKEWPLAPDGTCEWKCETSSDEMAGHFFGFAFYYDLCADEKEKAEIRDACCGMVDHMLENNLTLIDYDGKRTTWAMWAPNMLNNDDKWIWEKGINSLEILSFIKVAQHMSGDEKYRRAYWDLIENHHYAMNVIDQKIDDAHMCHIDDNLGFLCFATLLHLETEQSLRDMYLMGLATHWQYEKIERTPLWNFMYGAMTGDYCDLEAAVQGMREIPLSLVRYIMTNGTRKNLVYDTAQALWGGKAQLLEPLSYEERPINKWDGHPFRADGGNSITAEDGTMFLLPYWYARFYGLIEEAE